MPYVIGTAGHIDHGKTALVKALTNQDTDRLQEEKTRGISIDLGFAHLDLPDGTRAGVVDVPGHERFIRNMLAGAHGIDLVLFAVAADDGVMPQTEEHFDIVHLLGVPRAIFVITKSDLVPVSRILEVEDEIATLASGTAFQGSPVVHFSAVTGQGLDALRTLIAAIVRTDVARRADGYFRLPVDRVFVLQGHGLIVTGTALSGEVRVGDRVRCLPGDQVFRVRSLQVHNEPFAAGQWGQRVALNLTGADKASIERGHVICHQALTMTSERFDAFIEVRPTAGVPVRNHQRVRVHLGTAERLARLIVLGDTETVAPKESAYCQIVLAEPLLAMRGDHFIIRDETASRTLGGGIVIHPFARRHRKSDAGLKRRLDLLRTGSLADVIPLVLEESDTVATPLASLCQFANRPEAALAVDLQTMPGVRAIVTEGEKLYTTETRWERLRGELVALLRAFHAAHPLLPGMEMEAVRDALPGAPATRIFRAIVERLAADGGIVKEGSALRLPTHAVRFRADERALADTIAAMLARTPLTPPDVKQLQAESGADRTRLSEVLHVMEKEKSIVRVAQDLYFLREAVDAATAILRRRLSSGSDVTPATVRDLLGTSRKYVIPLLEFLDREGVTIRVRDVRRLR
jgi:selenocysteine-specific elongation factor